MGKKINPPTADPVQRAADKVIRAAELVKAGKGAPMAVVEASNALVWAARSAERDQRRGQA